MAAMITPERYIRPRDSSLRANESKLMLTFYNIYSKFYDIILPANATINILSKFTEIKSLVKNYSLIVFFNFYLTYLYTLLY